MDEFKDIVQMKLFEVKSCQVGEENGLSKSFCPGHSQLR
ncbi:hypothetical protein T01_2750 [Trichinella spiralis]|uniref:Uncharacterized protein n=1 Tax=Trichinella spiralis TaxID=6334 RepID=A0A0V1BJX5_TRISP|nr:hypothetical protein T01_2750 [Trichinella spiralis]